MQVLQTLLDGVRTTCAGFPDKRRGGAMTYSMADIGVSAFSLFFMQSESFLSHQRELEDGRKMSNCQSLFGMQAVPTDNHIRSMLDPVDPAHLQPAWFRERHSQVTLKFDRTLILKGFRVSAVTLLRTTPWSGSARHSRARGGATTWVPGSCRAPRRNGV